MLAITMGDPSGIGPEIIVKNLPNIQKEDFMLVGEKRIFERIAAVMNMDARFERVRNIAMAQEILRAGRVPVLEGGQETGEPPLFGVVSAEAGRAAYAALLKAADLACDRHVEGIVTAPLSKEALKAAGVSLPGHTEILAQRFGVSDVRMMLVAPALRVVLVSIHISLKAAIAAVTSDSVAQTIKITDAALRTNSGGPKIAVAGLNPHASEGGLFGDEEKNVITPAIERTKREGIDVSGPFAPDTIFMRARNNEFDVVVAQYHDQGLIPVKYEGLEKVVNVTLGLPIIRTSPGHGVAFDIAGKGVANPEGFLSAFAFAKDMVGRGNFTRRP